MNSASWQRRWRRLETHAVGVAYASLALSLALVLAGATWVLRSQEIGEWSRALDRLSLVLAQNTAQSISTSGLALESIAAVLPTDEALLRGDALQRAMRDKIGNVPQVTVASIIGADGVLRNATHAWLATASDLPERNALAYHSMHSGPAHHLGVPVRSGIDGAWIVYLSRRLDTPDGRFAGVAMAGISGASFAHLFHAIGVGQPVAISLASSDRTLLASWPRRDASIGNAFDASAASAAAGSAPMTARQPVPGYPLVVDVAVEHEKVLEGWRRRLPALGAVALIGMLGIGLAFAILVRRLRQRERDTVAALALTAQTDAAAAAANETVRHATMVAGSHSAHAPAGETAAAQAATVAPRTNMTAPRVLVVDDTDINRELLRILLEQLGCRVEEAVDGAEALVALAASKYDLVLMDCMMPVLDGYEACRRLRQRELATGAPRLAVAALTASAINGERARCLAAGMDDYLSKPFTPQQLGELVRRWT